MSDYLSDRERGPRTRLEEAIGDSVWRGLFALMQTRLDNDSFGYGFPERCSDGNALCGTNFTTLWDQAGAEIPDLVVSTEFGERWPPHPHFLPPTMAVLDLLQFLARAVAEPQRGIWHGYQHHHHLDFDREAGLRSFVTDINRLLARGGIAFELTSEGKARRLLPEHHQQLLTSVPSRTGDGETDKLLAAAKGFIVSPNFDTRRDAVEKLWDAFERIKTLEPGPDKKGQAEALIQRAAANGGPEFLAALSAEIRQLTDIGNRFRIRHSETNKEIITDAGQLDYLFFRMIGFINYVLVATDRGR